MCGTRDLDVRYGVTDQHRGRRFDAEDAQRAHRVDEQRVRAVEGVDEAAAVGGLDLGQPALLAPDVEHRLPVRVHCVLGLAVAADLETLLGEPLGLVEVARELCARAPQQAGPPAPDRALQRLGELGRRRDLDVGALDVAELEQVDDGPAGALELQLRIAGTFAGSGSTPTITWPQRSAAATAMETGLPVVIASWRDSVNAFQLSQEMWLGTRIVPSASSQEYAETTAAAVAGGF
jgi:hypothetical protein